MATPFKMKSQGSSFKMMGSVSPMKVCGPGDRACKLKAKKFDKPGTVVSRTAGKISDWFKRVTTPPKKNKKTK